MLNGRRVETGSCSAYMTLLDYLRRAGLTGAKEGCAEGECGACAVLIVAPQDGRSRYCAISSCLVLLHSLAGQEIYTVEGLAPRGQVNAPQAAIAAAGGSQCGYCTPGFAVSLTAEYYRPDRNGPCDPFALGGNLCRCTGYRPLRDAAMGLGAAPVDAFRARLDRPAPSVRPFSADCSDGRFERPGSLTECLTALASHPGARVVAGATDLGVELNLHGRRWPMLVSVECLPELRIFEDSPTAVKIGAGLTLSEIAGLWTSAPRAISDWLVLFASPLIRNRATLGGNLATASPVGDSAPLLLALDAEIRVAGLKGSRAIPLREFFTGYRETALRQGELIVSVRAPKPLPPRLMFYKVAKRTTNDISTVTAAFAVTTDRAGYIIHARAAYGGVAATPILSTEFERSLLGRKWNEATVRVAQDAVARGIAPIDDHRGGRAYRLALAQSLIEKFWWETRDACAE